MAGHSKWANIKHRKAAQDAKKGKVYTKILRDLSIAARVNPKPDDNPKLRAIIGKALSQNMSKDMIDRAIQKVISKNEEGSFEEAIYEGYAPAGVAVIVEVTTDNKNRTVGEVRHLFTKYGGALGVDGSVAYLFNRFGALIFENIDSEKLTEAAIELNAEDIDEADGMVRVLCQPNELFNLKTELEKRGFQTDNFSFVYEPTSEVSVDDAEKQEQISKLIDALDDLDDVVDVHSNLAS